MLYIENPKVNKKTIRVYTNINKVAWYMMSTQTTTAFLYTNNGQNDVWHINKFILQ